MGEGKRLPNKFKGENKMKTEIKALTKEIYHKSEVLPELLNYEQEIAVMAMGEEHKDAKLVEVLGYFERENDELNGALTESLDRFRKDCLMINNLIKAEISGKKGEEKAFNSLERLRYENRVIKNLELSNEELSTEIDAVVITKKGAFIVEVKNTRRDIFIDENGDYFRNGEFLVHDSNIAYKMQVKETLLREALDKLGYSGIKIFSIVVFTNRNVQVQNKYNGFKTCFLSQLHYIIDDWKTPVYLINRDLDTIGNALTETALAVSYPMNFDTDAVKENFYTLLEEMQIAKSQPKKAKWLQNIFTFFGSKTHKYAGAAAAAAIISTIG